MTAVALRRKFFKGCVEFGTSFSADGVAKLVRRHGASVCRRHIRKEGSRILQGCVHLRQLIFGQRLVSEVTCQPQCAVAHASRPTRQGGSRLKHARTCARRSCLRRTVAPSASTPCTLKTCFAKSNPIVVTSSMDGSHSLLIRSDSSLALR